MADESHLITLEVVALANGRYTVQAIGTTSVDDGGAGFATREQAENWLFAQNQQLDENASEIGIAKPGGGQAVC